MTRQRPAMIYALWAAAITPFFSTEAAADNLYQKSGWAGMATDRIAHEPGDSLTVLIFENSSASNTAENGSTRATSIGGRLTAGSSFHPSATLATNGSFTGSGETQRSGKMVAQISVLVDQVLPNGDLHVVGQQSLRINGERTDIKLQGRVRLADIAGDNSVASSKLADAAIDYDGTGFVTRGARPGIVTRIFNFLGIL